MRRLFARILIAALGIVVALVLGMLGVPAGVLQAETGSPNPVPPDDEIIVITSAGQLRVDDPTTPTGYTPVSWSSASEPGWETGWTVVAGGDFNGDGDAELVAARGSEVKVFDPIVQPGQALVEFSVVSGHWQECPPAEHR